MKTTIALLLLGSTLVASEASAQRRFPIMIPGQQRDATPFDLAIGRGDQALRRGDFAAAQTQFEQAARLNPRDARPSFYQGVIARRREQWAGAETLLRAALRLDARMAEAHAELGAVLRELNRAADSQAAFEAALRIDPSLGEAHYGLALCLEDAGQRDRAVSEYRSAVRLAPRDPMPALNLGMLLAAERPARGTQPRAEALSMLQSAGRNADGNVSVLSSAGPALRMLGEHSSAVDLLERARVASPTPSATVLAELAQALWGANRRPEALTRIGEAVGRAPTSAELHYVRALMQAESGDRPSATASLRLAVQHGGQGPIGQRARQRLTALGARP